MYVPLKDVDVWIDFENQTVGISDIPIDQETILTFGQLEVIVENIRLGLVSEGDEDVQ